MPTFLDESAAPLLLTVAATLTTGTATAAPVGLPVKHCINFGGMLDADWGKSPWARMILPGKSGRI
jgi:hypothetical protein